jgi:hypothetical protein
MPDNLHYNLFLPNISRSRLNTIAPNIHNIINFIEKYAYLCATVANV